MLALNSFLILVASSLKRARFSAQDLRVRRDLRELKIENKLGKREIRKNGKKKNK